MPSVLFIFKFWSKKAQSKNEFFVSCKFDKNGQKTAKKTFFGFCFKT